MLVSVQSQKRNRTNLLSVNKYLNLLAECIAGEISRALVASVMSDF